MGVFAGIIMVRRCQLRRDPVEKPCSSVRQAYSGEGKIERTIFTGTGRQRTSVTAFSIFADGEVYHVLVNRMRGRLNVTGRVRIADAELRLFPLGKEIGRGAVIVTGTAEYRFAHAQGICRADSGRLRAPHDG